MCVFYALDARKLQGAKSQNAVASVMDASALR